MKDFTRKTFAVCTALLMFSLGLTPAIAADSNGGSSNSGTAVYALEADDVIVTDDVQEYSNNEIFVTYNDGSFEVLSYANDAALEAGLEQLSEDKNVASVQPNYIYTSEGTVEYSTNDKYNYLQWALYNDGSFTINADTNTIPVYTNPFMNHNHNTANVPFLRMGEDGNIEDIEGVNDDSYSTSAEGDQNSLSYSTSQNTAAYGIDINLGGAIDTFGSGGRNVVIAMIDTGIDSTHEDLNGALWINEDEIPGNNADDDNNGYVDDTYGWNFYNRTSKMTSTGDDSHGTHGAGTIKATANNDLGISGIIQSDKVKIMSLKALGGANGTGSTASIISAIRYAESNGAVICNLSLGSSVNDKALYNAMASSPMLFVVASGNDGLNADEEPCYPAAYDLDNIISVANMSYTGNLNESSNYGRESVDLAAPGTYILSTTTGNRYSFMTGTSMAAPMVSAAAAMVYSHYTDIDIDDVKKILLSTVTELDSLKGLISSDGLLNIGAAINLDNITLSELLYSSNTSAKGSAPVITATAVNLASGKYLKVKVTDEDGDLDKTLYAPGALTTHQMCSGAFTTEFKLTRFSNGWFKIKTGGTYTFYASDAEGHEVINTVTVTP